MTDTLSQFICVIGYGRAPRKGAPDWACVAGITREGARAPGACNHIRLRAEPVIIYGISPIEAGQLATARADQAFDHGKRCRRLRRDGWALLAGVASYPVPRENVESDPAQKRRYLIWQKLTLRFLKRNFRDHLKSVVEHTDKKQLHLHFYAVPQLGFDSRLDMRDIHPGLVMKRDAEEADASKKDQDAAYRSGLSRWQDDYWWAVSRHFEHARFGPRRMRVSRRQRLMERQMEEAAARQQAMLGADRKQMEEQQACRRAALDAERRQFDQEMTQRRAELESTYVQRMAEAGERGRLAAKAIANLVVARRISRRRFGEEQARRQAAEAEIERLRALLAELEQATSMACVA